MYLCCIVSSAPADWFRWSNNILVLLICGRIFVVSPLVVVVQLFNFHGEEQFLKLCFPPSQTLVIVLCISIYVCLYMCILFRICRRPFIFIICYRYYHYDIFLFLLPIVHMIAKQNNCLVLEFFRLLC